MRWPPLLLCEKMSQFISFISTAQDERGSVGQPELRVYGADHHGEERRGWRRLALADVLVTPGSVERVDLPVSGGGVDHERHVRLLAGGEEGVVDAACGSCAAPGEVYADLLQGQGRAGCSVYCAGGGGVVRCQYRLPCSMVLA